MQTLREGTLSGVLETISPMINALRMVWVISRYYSEDANMGILFERIAYQVKKLQKIS
jgi:dynein heavy chain